MPNKKKKSKLKLKSKKTMGSAPLPLAENHFDILELFEMEILTSDSISGIEISSDIIFPPFFSEDSLVKVLIRP